MSARSRWEADDEPFEDGWSRVPHGLWRHPDLTQLDKVLIGWLWSHDGKYLATLSTSQIRRDFGGNRAVDAALARLADAGFIEKNTPPRGATVYRRMTGPWRALLGVRQERPVRDPHPEAVRDPQGVPVRDPHPVEDQREEQGEVPDAPASGPPDEQTPGQRAHALFQRWCEWWREDHPAGSFPTALPPPAAVKIIRAVIESGAWSEREIRAGLKVIARDGFMSVVGLETAIRKANPRPVLAAPSADLLDESSYQASYEGDLEA